MLSVKTFNQFTPLAHIWVTPPDWQEVIRAMENSSYFESLDAKAKERFREKLSCVGLSIQDDPYLPTNDARFVNDMATWPRIEFSHIFAYFITRPGLYTQEQLLS